MKRVAFIVEDITRFGGTERAVTNLLPLFESDNDYSIDIISLYSQKTDKAAFVEEDMNRRIIHIGASVRSKIDRILFYCKLPKLLMNISREKRIDILVGTTHAINCIISFVKSTKVIGCEHRVYEACPRTSSLIRRIAYKKLDGVVVLTKADSKKYSFIKDGRVHVIPNAVSFRVDEPSKLKYNRILAVGRLDKNKGFDNLIKAVDILKNSMPTSWHIDIFGAGEEESNLLFQIETRGLEKLIKINRPVRNIKSEYLHSDILVMTSYNEGLPMALIEGQTCGLPIVSYDCPNGPNEIVTDGVDGYLVKVGDIETLAKRILEIIKDDKLKEQFGTRALLSSRRFSGDTITIMWKNLFDSVAQRGN